MKRVETPIRVAGIGAWLSGTRGPDAIRERFERGGHCFGPLPSLRYDPDVFAEELPEGHPRYEIGATFGDVEVDWRALRLPPLSVARMHTMEKVALAVMAEALEDAGIQPRAREDMRVRVVLAATTLGPDPRTDHGRRIRRHELAAPVAAALQAEIPDRAAEVSEYVDRLFDLVAPPVEPDSMMSSASIVAGRICNLYDFRGGHIALDASSVSSLAAVETAIADLRAGVCDLALVCAVSPLLTASAMLSMAHRGLLSPTPPRPFCPGATGTVLGEGAIALVLDRGDAAPRQTARGWIEAIAGAALPRRSGDPIEAAVAEVAASALTRANVDPTEVAFVTSRAGGMPAIDRGEAVALAGVYGSAGRSTGLPVACSVPVFGWLGGAAGMLALAHGVLALESGRLHAPVVDGAAVPNGLLLGAVGEPLAADARAGVSDAGLAPIAYHAIIAAPGARRNHRVEVRGAVADEGAIAITGLGIVAPGASDVQTFWDNVLARVDSIGDLPPSRWDVDRFVDASEELGAILKTRLAAPVRLPELDPARHRISPSMLEELDPAVLLSLDVAEQALRECGAVEAWDRERVSVIAGQLSLRWAEAELEKRALFSGHLALVRDAMAEAQFDPGRVAAVVRGARQRFDADNPRKWSQGLNARTGLECAAHVARAWSLSGPLLSVDGACASSLAAVERATRQLLDRDVDAAIAIGVAYNLLPEYYVVLSILGALSPRGAPPFHLGADGFVPGEGAACVVLERLADAQRRGARIHAVLRGIGCSSDGKGVSIFAPNTDGELTAIQRALEASGWSPADVDLVEAHGTGTKLGDETEVRAYERAYGERDWTVPLAVGTVKSQVGHLSSAAGMVGLVKAVLAVREGVLPPTLGELPQPELALERGPLRLSADARPWVVPAHRKRRAGVSAFGLGGINYHVLIEEPPPSPGDSTRPTRPSPQARRPARSPLADRFETELVPCALGNREPRYPFGGRVVWLIPDRGRVWKEVGAVVEGRGGRVTVVDSPHALQSAPPADGIIDLSTFGLGPGDPFAADIDALATERVTFALQAIAACYDRMASAPHGQSFYAAVTSMGGELGLAGVDRGQVAGAALVGLAKGLKQELPNTLSRGIDFAPDESPDTIGEVLVRELEDGNDQLEVAWAGRRLVTRLRRLALEDGASCRPVDESDVIVVSGGGRGVVFECATALARLGARVIVCGRTPVPSEGAPYLDLDEDEFAAWGREHMLVRRREQPSLSPRALRQEIEAAKRERELWANLRRSHKEELPLTYECCDVVDADAVRKLVDRVRATYGPITGVAHGAMVQWSTLASRKEPAKIAKTLEVKSRGLINLLAATKIDPLKVVLCFGSGAGRFGNRGQTDYCAANALMAARLASIARADERSTRFVTVDWTAWDSVGAAVEDRDLADLLRTTGITSISVEEGLYWFVREWTAGTSSEVVVLEERMLHDWPFLGRQAEHDRRGPVEVDDLGRPFVEGAWPLVDRVLERKPDRIVIERRLEIDSDAFVDQHRLHGVPILPATFGCELLAEVAALCVPGFEIETAHDVRIEAPAKLFREQPLLLRATARIERSDSTEVIVHAQTRSRLLLRGRALTDRVHHSARFRLRPSGARSPSRLDIVEIEGTARARSFFHMARDPVTLGPLYSRGRWIQVRDRTVIGSIRAPRLRDAMRRSSWPLFQVDPLMMDTAFQIAANWDGLGGGYVSIPYGMAELRLGRRRRRDEGARVRATVTRVETPDVYYDIDVATEGGDMLMEIRGLHLRRITSPNDAR